VTSENAAGKNIAQVSAKPAVSIIIPYYNEEAYLPKTLSALACQRGVTLHFILVNNASTDGSADCAAHFKAAHPQHRVTLVDEDQPGQVPAMHAATRYIDTPWTAFCDADSQYPDHYLSTAVDLMSRKRAVGAFAYNASPSDSALIKAVRGFLRGQLTPFVLRKQCHAGGYAHVYRSDALIKSGAYNPELWPFVIFDHELAHRVLMHGRIVYDPKLYCFPDLTRRADRSDVSWTLFERLMYHVTPFGWKDWFFYSFMAKRFKRRGQYHVKLRQQPWNQTAH